MIKRTVEVSAPDLHLSLRHGQVEVRRGDERLGSVPVEDLGLLIVDTPTASYSHATLIALLRAGGVVVLCGDDHTPAAILAPLDANSTQAERLRAQIGASVPLQKQLWRQIVRAKIAAQAAATEDDLTRRAIARLVPKVRSGDPSNVEGHAARLYWGVYLGADATFRRRAEGGDPPNGLLNYGYMVLRAATARAVVGAGLHPSLGLGHRNRYNAFALADDLMEPFRPLVDVKVREMVRLGFDDVTKETKRDLLAILTATVSLEGERGPLAVALERLAVSLLRCFEGTTKKLDLPALDAIGEAVPEEEVSESADDEDTDQNES